MTNETNGIDPRPLNERITDQRVTDRLNTMLTSLDSDESAGMGFLVTFNETSAVDLGIEYGSDGEPGDITFSDLILTITTPNKEDGDYTSNSYTLQLNEHPNQHLTITYTDREEPNPVILMNDSPHYTEIINALTQTIGNTEHDPQKNVQDEEVLALLKSYIEADISEDDDPVEITAEVFENMDPIRRQELIGNALTGLAETGEVTIGSEEAQLVISPLEREGVEVENAFQITFANPEFDSGQEVSDTNPDRITTELRFNDNGAVIVNPNHQNLFRSFMTENAEAITAVPENSPESELEATFAQIFGDDSLLLPNAITLTGLIQEDSTSNERFGNGELQTFLLRRLAITLNRPENNPEEVINQENPLDPEVDPTVVESIGLANEILGEQERRLDTESEQPAGWKQFIAEAAAGFGAGMLAKIAIAQFIPGVGAAALGGAIVTGLIIPTFRYYIFKRNNSAQVWADVARVREDGFGKTISVFESWTRRTLSNLYNLPNRIDTISQFGETLQTFNLQTSEDFTRTSEEETDRILEMYQQLSELQSLAGFDKLAIVDLPEDLTINNLNGEQVPVEEMLREMSTVVEALINANELDTTEIDSQVDQEVSSLRFRAITRRAGIGALKGASLGAAGGTVKHVISWAGDTIFGESSADIPIPTPGEVLESATQSQMNALDQYGITEDMFKNFDGNNNGILEGKELEEVTTWLQDNITTSTNSATEQIATHLPDATYTGSHVEISGDSFSIPAKWAIGNGGNPEHWTSWNLNPEYGGEHSILQKRILELMAASMSESDFNSEEAGVVAQKAYTLYANTGDLNAINIEMISNEMSQVGLDFAGVSSTEGVLQNVPHSELAQQILEGAANADPAATALLIDSIGSDGNPGRIIGHLQDIASNHNDQIGALENAPMVIENIREIVRNTTNIITGLGTTGAIYLASTLDTWEKAETEPTPILTDQERSEYINNQVISHFNDERTYFVIEDGKLVSREIDEDIEIEAWMQTDPYRQEFLTEFIRGDVTNRIAQNARELLEEELTDIEGLDTVIEQLFEEDTEVARVFRIQLQAAHFYAALAAQDEDQNANGIRIMEQIGELHANHQLEGLFNNQALLGAMPILRRYFTETLPNQIRESEFISEDQTAFSNMLHVLFEQESGEPDPIPTELGFPNLTEEEARQVNKVIESNFEQDADTTLLQRYLRDELISVDDNRRLIELLNEISEEDLTILTPLTLRSRNNATAPAADKEEMIVQLLELASINIFQDTERERATAVREIVFDNTEEFGEIRTQLRNILYELVTNNAPQANFETGLIHGIRTHLLTNSVPLETVRQLAILKGFEAEIINQEEDKNAIVERIIMEQAER